MTRLLLPPAKDSLPVKLERVRGTPPPGRIVKIPCIRRPYFVRPNFSTGLGRAAKDRLSEAVFHVALIRMTDSAFQIASLYGFEQDAAAQDSHEREEASQHSSAASFSLHISARLLHDLTYTCTG